MRRLTLSAAAAVVLAMAAMPDPASALPAARLVAPQAETADVVQAHWRGRGRHYGWHRGWHHRHWGWRHRHWHHRHWHHRHWRRW